jgi:hypothetical protein
MADIVTSEIFADTQTVNGARMNNIVASSVIQKEFVTAKAADASPDPANDYLLTYDASASALKKSKIADVIASAVGVTSVGLALPTSVFTVTGSPVTSTGTLTGAFKNQSGNKFFVSPADGSSGVPTMRALDPRDLYQPSVLIAALAIDWQLGSRFYKTLAATSTFTFANAVDGADILVKIDHAGFVAHFPAGVKWPDNAPPGISTGLSVYRFINFNGTLMGIILGNSFA